MKKTLCVIATVIVLVMPISGMAELPYQTGFEAAEGFVLNQSINGVDGWQTIGDAAATITDAQAQGGAQSVSLEPNSQIDKPLSAAPAESIIWMEGYFRGEGTTAEASFPPSSELPASAIVFFKKTGIQCYNGDTSSWEDTGVTPDPDNWIKISVRQDYTSKKWRCYINNAPAPDKELGFRDAEVTTLNGFRNFADTQSWFDTFRVIAVIKGDANSDSKVDAADIVALVNDLDGSELDLIQQDNADIDNNGSIDAADLTSLINKILGRS